MVNCIYYDINLIPSNYDVVFITNPTQLHVVTLNQFRDKGKHFFVEKPFCTVEQLKCIKIDTYNKDAVFYVAGPLRYNQIIKYVKHNIDLESVLSVRSISSSYLPDWRPQTDYTKSYSAHKKLGGGVSIDLIHEWDYITYLFGMPNKVKSLICHKSDLKIDSDDLAIYIAEYKNMTVEVHVDYVGRVPIRELCLITKEDTIICDLLKGAIHYLKSGKIIEFNCDRNTYQMAEIEHFFELIKEKRYGNKNIRHAMDVLRIAGDMWEENK